MHNDPPGSRRAVPFVIPNIPTHGALLYKPSERQPEQESGGLH